MNYRFLTPALAEIREAAEFPPISALPIPVYIQKSSPPRYLCALRTFLTCRSLGEGGDGSNSSTAHCPLSTRHFHLPLPDISVSLPAIMKRRSFLSLSALSAVPVVARAAEDAPEQDWYETITSDVMKFRCSDAEDRVVFEVELFQPAESDIKEATDAQGDFLHDLYKDQPQPYPVRPGVNPCSPASTSPGRARR